MAETAYSAGSVSGSMNRSIGNSTKLTVRRGLRPSPSGVPLPVRCACLRNLPLLCTRLAPLCLAQTSPAHTQHFHTMTKRPESAPGAERELALRGFVRSVLPVRRIHIKPGDELAQKCR